MHIDTAVQELMIFPTSYSSFVNVLDFNGKNMKYRKTLFAAIDAKHQWHNYLSLDYYVSHYTNCREPLLSIHWLMYSSYTRR